MNNKQYLVIWTYVANYGTMNIVAQSPEAAAEQVKKGMSDDFRLRGTLYVVPAHEVYISKREDGKTDE